VLEVKLRSVLQIVLAIVLESGQETKLRLKQKGLPEEVQQVRQE